ncbi:coiled-coil domain-containing protein 55-domain containing protein, partial [Dimargaris cristalligena]
VDPSIYAYDEVFDAMKEAKDRAKAQRMTSASKNKPRYIENLIKVAQQRKEDHAVVRERRILEQQGIDDEQFGDKEVFVTGGYKKHKGTLQDKNQEEQRQQERDIRDRQRLEGAGLYRQFIERSTDDHRAVVQAGVLGKRDTTSTTNQSSAKSDTGSDDVQGLIHDAIKRGEEVVLNDDQQVVDKRQLLKPGLNIIPKKKLVVAPQSAGAGRPRGPSRFSSNRDTGAHRTAGLSSFNERKGSQPPGGHGPSSSDTSHLSPALLASLQRRNDEASIAAARERYLVRRQLRLDQ